MINRFSFLTTLLAVFAFAATALTQSSDGGDVVLPDGPPRDIRKNAVRELGLTHEQAQQIRRINEERRAELNASNRRLREARRALDDAIYADVVDESLVKSRLTELRSAQGDAATLRFEKELAIRRVLTPAQLIRFREFRRKFDESREGPRIRRDQQNRHGAPPPAGAAPPAPMRQFMKRQPRPPR